MKTTLRRIIPVLALTLLVAFGARAADDFVADELLVGFKPGTRGAQADGVRNGIGAARINAWPEIAAEHWRLPHGLAVDRAIQALAANPNVLYAEPNHVIHADVVVPNDASRSQLWAMYNTGQSGGTPDADIDALEAWQWPPGAGQVVVAVLDSGVDFDHPDLAGTFFLNSGETGLDALGRNKATNGVDDDGNGRVDDWCGWDFVNNDNHPMDDYSHGTHVTGTIAGVGNNGIGVIGVAGLNPNVRIMPLKILNSSGMGSLSMAVDALVYAGKFVDAYGQKLVRISNNSYTSGTTKSKTVESAVKAFQGVFVAAAGNDGLTTVTYPAGYASANVIAVAATDRNDQLASYSNRGSWVHVGAPGTDVYSTLPGGGYGFNSGTSMATPHVSGIAALVLSQNPGWSISGVRAQVIGTVDLLPSLSGNVSSGGRVNARRALGAGELTPESNPPAAVTDLAAATASAHSVILTWTAPADNSATYQYDIRWSRSPITTDAEFAAAGQVNNEPNPGPVGSVETFTVENLPDQSTLYFALKTMDLFGNASPISNGATAATLVADWFYVRLDWGYNMGNEISLGVTDQGFWAVAYDDANAGVLKCASLLPNKLGFTSETVMSSSGSPALVYSSTTGEIGISHRYGAKLYFCAKNASSWVNTAVDSRDVAAGETSLGYGSSEAPFISYLKGGRSPGLYVARRIGTTWSTQQVDSQAKAAIYNQMAMDLSGNPGIAYSHDADANGTVDTLKFAHFDGVNWTKSNVEAGGSFATVAYNPVDGRPALAHWNRSTGQLRYLAWTGTAWSPEVVVTAPSVTGLSLAFGPDGVAYLAYGTTEMLLAKRDLSGVWTTLSIDQSTQGGLRNSLKGRPLSIPTGVAYQGPSDPGFQVGPNPEDSVTVRLAFRKTPYP